MGPYFMGHRQDLLSGFKDKGQTLQSWFRALILGKIGLVFFCSTDPSV